MAKFSVEVTCIVERRYTVEVEADNEDKAEQAAANLWRDQLDDFDVDKVDRWKFESEQLTNDCHDCGKEYSIQIDTTNTCNCAALGTYMAPFGFGSQVREENIPHIVVDGNHVAAPWWHQDNDYCAACGKIAEAKDEEEARGR